MWFILPLGFSFVLATQTGTAVDISVDLEEGGSSVERALQAIEVARTAAEELDLERAQRLLVGALATMRQRAYELDSLAPMVDAGVLLGLSLYLMGDEPGARSAFAEVFSVAPRARIPRDLSNAAIRAATERVRERLLRGPRGWLVLSGDAAAAEDLIVRIDDRPFELRAGDRVELLPGSHYLRVSLDGRHFAGRVVQLRAHETHEVDIAELATLAPRPFAPLTASRPARGRVERRDDGVSSPSPRRAMGPRREYVEAASDYRTASTSASPSPSRRPSMTDLGLEIEADAESGCALLFCAPTFVPWVVGVAGLGALGAGVGLWVDANSVAARYRMTPGSDPLSPALRSQAIGEANAGTAMLVVGGVLVSAALSLWVFGDGEAADADRAPSSADTFYAEDTVRGQAFIAALPVRR